MDGILYVVSTPIGNLKDISERAVSTLKLVDFVVAEDRERARKLLNSIGVKKSIVTINSYTEKKKAKVIVKKIKNGASCALISGAGTPCISDPGFFVVSSCHDERIEVKVVPGPSALTAAIAVSGIPMDRFLFWGFLPQRKSKKRKILKELAGFPYPIIFFESPRRLLETLRLIHEMLGLRRIAIMREMTKIHEEVIRTNTEKAPELFETKNLLGEFTIIVDRAERRE
ncbi:MAG: 16S rRNA (cytidine(1402)-2'-O)-methyltransferase [Desulfobacterota bacterium]|nr:16S rRNA (cytidine(1402)-2'-O)-methyltransferase [Thermodesulfobacteriota bacterium]MDW8001657.1 16S rRNA (cytidine(1402)-2'-O)-methyltransferase [Deltaproteobacteria bacterium]